MLIRQTGELSEKENVNASQVMREKSVVNWLVRRTRAQLSSPFQFGFLGASKFRDSVIYCGWAQFKEACNSTLLAASSGDALEVLPQSTASTTLYTVREDQILLL